MSPTRTPAERPTPTRDDLAARVAEQHWYHTIALPGRIDTPGFFDTRAAAGRVPLPESLAGRRCLDVGSCDGFWAFEMERRGAAEVVAIDVDDPLERDWPGAGPPTGAPDARRAQGTFTTASDALGSSVRRMDLSVYDVSPEAIGRFDFVFIGNLLLHLRDPMRALGAIRSVVDGELLSVDVVSLWATLKHPLAPSALLSRQVTPYWWIPNLAAYRHYFSKAGYELVDAGRPFFIPFGKGFVPRPPLAKLARSPQQLWFWTVLRWFGSPTAWVRARPL